jgi:predicted GNAT family acetyltransferase
VIAAVAGGGNFKSTLSPASAPDQRDHAMSEAPDPELVDNVARHRFEISVDGHAAFILYRPFPGGLILVHTEVPKALEGRGIGGRLVKATLLTLRGRGVKIRPDCPFVRSYIERHPEFADLVAG